MEMRWCAILLGLLFLTPAPAFADTQVNACGRYAIWVPDTWKVMIKNERLTAESPDSKLYLVAAPIDDQAADLIDEDVVDFIDAELDSIKMTSDRRQKLGGVEARVMEGTGMDDSDMFFRAVALDPSENETVIEMMVYGAPNDMKRPANKAIIDRIVASFKPPPHADKQVNACGRYSIWVPDTWKVTIKNQRLTAESRDNELYMVVAPIEDKTADLLDDDVGDFIDAELDNMKITSDRREKLDGLEARIVEGTGTDDGDMFFRAVALKPSDDDGVIEMLIYGAPGEMKRPANRAIIDRIVRSFRPM
jgi:hypothetical protein